MSIKKRNSMLREKLLCILCVEVDQFTHENRFACQNIGTTFLSDTFITIIYIKSTKMHPLLIRWQNEKKKKEKNTHVYYGSA